MIDVRSPAEFTQGHLPQATNVPLLDDEERVVVGTVYRKHGRQPAIDRGLELIGPKLLPLLKAARRVCPNNSCQIYCARGGMRSEYFSWLLDTGGINVTILEGGYKSFRRTVLAYFESPLNLNVLSGLTGAGKTDVLKRLELAGEQVVDLEAYANHRGSAFGGIGLPPQPTTEQFENRLFWRMLSFEEARPIWLEDESRRIGKVNLPAGLWKQMQKSLAIFLEVDIERRVQYLTNCYGALDRERVQEAIERIRKRLGGARANSALNAIAENRMEDAVRILLDYYDATYRHASERAPRERLVPFPGTDPNHAFDVRKLIEFSRSL